MSKKILLVADDDDMNRLIIRKFLGNEYEVIEAESGTETMEILQSTPVDALLLDIIMPGLDGLEVLERMKKEEKYDHVGILVATSTKEKTEREALALGADDIVSKPYDPIVIKKRLENILAVKRLQTQRDLLQKQDMTGYWESKSDDLGNKMIASVQKIEKFLDVIRANKSNYKLVDEMVDEIKAEAHKSVEFISTNE